jgi:hypothetical protein
VSFAPALDYFILRNVSVGVELTFSYTNSNGYVGNSLSNTKVTLLGGGFHFGLNLPITSAFSVWPLLSVGFHHITDTVELPPTAALGAGSTNSAETGPWISGAINVLYHPVEHFFLGVGPVVYHNFATPSGAETDETGIIRTTLGVSFVLGGYFDPSKAAAEADGVEAAPEEPDEKARRFGDADTFVLSDESGFSWSSRTYSGYDSKSAFNITAGFDWFFVRKQSLGMAVFYSLSHPVQPRETSVDQTGALVRYGFVVPFNSWFSIYPRLSLTYSVVSRDLGVDIATGTTSITSTEKILGASIFVPAMVQLATHLFVGLGPSVAQDIVHTVQFQNGTATADGEQNRRTGFGASTIIGGWL